jgi:tetratricopeptide (TPR) repeat protein
MSLWRVARRTCPILLITLCCSCGPQRGQARRAVSNELSAREQARRESNELYRRAVAERGAGHDDAARALLGRAVRLDDGNVHAWMALGAVEFDSERYLEAAEAFHRAAKLAPSRYEPHFNFGTVLEAVGRYDDAIHAYETASELAPDEVEVIENLARTLVRARRDPERTRMLIDRALELEYRPEWVQWLRMQAVRLAPASRPARLEPPGAMQPVTTQPDAASPSAEPQRRDAVEDGAESNGSGVVPRP